MSTWLMAILLLTSGLPVPLMSAGPYTQQQCQQRILEMVRSDGRDDDAVLMRRGVTWGCVDAAYRDRQLKAMHCMPAARPETVRGAKFTTYSCVGE